MGIKAQFVKDLCVVGELGRKNRFQVGDGFDERPMAAGDDATCASRFFCNYLLIPGADTGNQRGSFARCDGRLRALP